MAITLKPAESVAVVEIVSPTGTTPTPTPTPTKPTPTAPTPTKAPKIPWTWILLGLGGIALAGLLYELSKRRR